MFDSHQFFNTFPICCLFTAFIFLYNFIDWLSSKSEIQKHKNLCCFFQEGSCSQKSLLFLMKIWQKDTRDTPSETGREEAVGVCLLCFYFVLLFFVLLPWGQKFSWILGFWKPQVIIPGVDDHLQFLTLLHPRCNPHCSCCGVFFRVWYAHANSQETPISVTVLIP